MYISLFTDEFGEDVYKVLPVVAGWGMKYVDFRGLINGKPIEKQTDEELRELKRALDGYGLKTGVIQSSLCKVHLPDKERIADEMKKLEGIIRASEILDCRLVRSFNFWQHNQNDPACGELAMRPDELIKVVEMFEPFRKRAKEAGLILGFENCGQTPNEVIAFLKAINEPEWGMAWDVSNMFELLPEAEGDCIEYFTKALTAANMIHVKSRGVSAITELDYKKVPWDRVLAGAATIDRDIPVSIETHVPADSTLAGQGMEVSKRCYDYIKKVWPESAPADLKTALTPKLYFDRPYKDNPVRFVVVGLGMGKNRCAQITSTCGLELVGVCDINLNKAKEVGELYNVKYSDDINVFLNDPSVEVMYIVTPTGLHCEIADQCLNAGKHVLLTKPMDATVEACDRTIALAKEKGLMLGIDFDLHFRGPLTELKMAADRGFFGKILSANMILNVRRSQEYYDENGGWRGTWALDGGAALSNQGIHEINRLITILGVPDRVKATIARQTFDIEAEDLGMGQWEYDNGCVARISATTSYPAGSWYTRLEIIGDKGVYLQCNGGPEGNHTYWWKDGVWSEDAPYKYEREWCQGSDNFGYCLRMNTELVVGAEAGRCSRYVLEKMYESAKNGEGWVDIEK
ncbi:MAG: Gfo/Idh/MocA family oxidoreductase [Monoglobaceae bacterium]